MPVEIGQLTITGRFGGDDPKQAPAQEALARLRRELRARCRRCSRKPSAARGSARP